MRKFVLTLAVALSAGVSRQPLIQP